MKQLIPIRVILNLNPDGTLKDGVFQYQIRIDGASDGKLPTIGLPSITNEATDVIEAAIARGKQSEGIDE